MPGRERSLPGIFYLSSNVEIVIHMCYNIIEDSEQIKRGEYHVDVGVLAGTTAKIKNMVG